MIEILNKRCLNYPSNDLYNLIKKFEETVMEFVSKEILNMDTFFQILSNLNISKCQMIGCHEHNNLLTKKTIYYFILIRANILAKTYNAVHSTNRKKNTSGSKTFKIVEYMPIIVSAIAIYSSLMYICNYCITIF